MHLYFAGIYANGLVPGARTYLSLTPEERAARDAILFHLESYHYIDNATKIRQIRRDKKTVFLDSGAFSAYTKGVEISVRDYVQYIKDNRDIIIDEDGALLASVLDGIGDPLKTFQNQAEMERLGVTPLPCFHYGEDERYLDFYIQHYPYITLGGMVPISKPQLRLWLDRIWRDHLCDKDGKPKLKVHGFGMTSLDLMLRYPWHSVDSSSWVQVGSNGAVYTRSWGTVHVSEHAPSRKTEGRHYDTMPRPQQEAFEAEIAANGFTIKRLREEYVSRWVYSICTFNQIQREILNKERVFKPEQEDLFAC